MAATHTFPLTIAPDGAAISNSNCAYVCSYIGSDSNAGTKEAPFATKTKANTSSYAYVYCVGVFTENVTLTNKTYFSSYLGASIDNGAITGTSSSTAIYNMSMYSLINTGYPIKIYNSIIKTSSSANDQGGYAGINLFFNTMNQSGYGDDSAYHFKNITTISFINKIATSSVTAGRNKITDGIIINDIDLYNYTALTVSSYPIFNNFILRKALIWKWNGVIVPITYTAATGVLSTDSTQWKTDIYNSLTTYYNTLSTSTSKTYLASILSNWSVIFPSTTMVVDDINCCPIFNLYSSGAPIDYSLKISNTNPALTMSSVGSYVGAYLASITPVYDNTTLKELDSNGVETTNTPDILLVGSQGNMYPSPSATQYRNRIKTNVLTYPRGYSFSNGVQSMLTSGLSARYQYGKRQTYTTVYIPQESIHVEAFDNLTTRSSFPMFSAKLNGATQVWYHTNGAGTVAITTGGVITGTGTAFTTNFVVGQMIYVGNEGHAITAINSATSMNVASWSVAVAAGSSYASIPTNKLNTQVLFSDLSTYYNISSDLNMTEYGAWAVSNADYETYLLSSKTGVTLRTPFLKYLKFWIEINYYD